MSVIAQMSQEIQRLKKENETLLRTMRLHVGDCCSLSNEVDMFRGYWNDSEEVVEELVKLIKEIMENIYGLYWKDSLYSNDDYKHIPVLIKRIKKITNA